MTFALIAVAFAAFGASDLVEGDPVELSSGHLFAEGPQWLPGKGLIFSDVVGDTIYNGERGVFRKPSERTNGIAIDPQGRVLMCESKLRRIARLETDGKVTVLAEKFEGKPFNTTNDIVVRSDGLVYFTDPGAKSTTELDFNGVYLLDPASGRVTLLSKTHRYPNGIDLSPDEKILFVADYMRAAIYAYDVAADGTVANERVHAEIPNPDGFAVDAEGKIWVAAKEGVGVIDAKGKIMEIIKIPTPPTNCAFGGEDGKTLFVTARQKVFKLQSSTPGTKRF